MSTGADLLCFIKPIFTSILFLIRQIKCGDRVYGIVVPSKCGKTVFSNKINDNDTYSILDLEENLKLVMDVKEKEIINNLHGASQKLHLYPIAERYVNDILKNNIHRSSNKKLLILCSDIDLLRYCGIKERNLLCFAPSQELTSLIKGSTEASELERFEQSKMDIVLKAKTIITFNSFDDLSKEIMNRFKNLQLKL